MKKNLNQTIRRVPPFNWGYTRPSSGVIDLLLGENLDVMRCVQAALQEELFRVNKYPDQLQKVRTQLAEYLNIDVDQVFLTNGSDDAIDCVARTVLNSGDNVLIPSPTFPVYEMASKLMGAKVKTFSTLSSDKQQCLPSSKIALLIAAKLKQNISVVWLANPNNPTGNVLLSLGEIENLAREFPETYFVIDECYAEFANISAVQLIQRFSNVIIIGSFSKSFGIAGLRFGYVVANKQIAEQMLKLQAIQPFRVNRMSLSAVSAILNNPGEMTVTKNTFQKNKQLFEKKLENIPELEMYKTFTSFSFCRIKKAEVSASALVNQLAQEKILIKNCALYGELPDSFIRIGVPPRKIQDTVVQAIKKILTNKNSR